MDENMNQVTVLEGTYFQLHILFLYGALVQLVLMFFSGLNSFK